jgi:hypothetical protein
MSGRPCWAEGFLSWLAEQPPPVTWMQVRIDAGWRLRHVDDAADEHLAPVEDWEILARTDAAGAYRPLPTAPDLRRGWEAGNLDDDALIEALEALYPGGLALWHAERAGRLAVVDWHEVQRRQTGWQGLVKRLTDDDVRAAAAGFCADERCLRRVLWRVGEEAPPRGGGAVPCAVPCSLFLAHVQAIAAARRDAGRAA